MQIKLQNSTFTSGKSAWNYSWPYYLNCESKENMDITTVFSMLLSPLKFTIPFCSIHFRWRIAKRKWPFRPPPLPSEMFRFLSAVEMLRRSLKDVHKELLVCLLKKGHCTNALLYLRKILYAPSGEMVVQLPKSPRKFDTTLLKVTSNVNLKKSRQQSCLDFCKLKIQCTFSD